MSSLQLSFSIMLSLSVCAVICDLKMDRIPNILLLSGSAAGLLLQIESAVAAGTEGADGIHFFAGLLTGACRGILVWCLAAALPLCAGLFLFRHRLMGAGDSKLLAALAGIGGPASVFPLLFGSLAAGGICALAIMFRFSLFRKRFHIFASNIEHASAELARSPGIFPFLSGGFQYDSGDVSPDLSLPGHELRFLRSGRMHFSIPVLTAVLICAVSAARTGSWPSL